MPRFAEHVRRRLLWAAATLLALLAGVGPGSAGEDASENPARLALEQSVVPTVVAWLDCDPCEQGELGNVVEAGVLAVPILEAALRQGPTAATVEALRHHLVGAFFKLERTRAAIEGGAPARGLESFVEGYLAAHDVRIRLRAVAALERIEGKDAAAALRAAGVDRELPGAVREVVEKILGTASPTRFRRKGAVMQSGDAAPLRDHD
jgi:hypothetical protein